MNSILLIQTIERQPLVLQYPNPLERYQYVWAEYSFIRLKLYYQEQFYRQNFCQQLG
jgi:hypothetical protein